MKNFYVYQHPKYGQKIEKSGFTFFGLFFTIIWLLVKRLYIPALAFFLLFFIATLSDRIITDLMEQRIEKIASLPQLELNEIDRYKDIYWEEIEPANANLSSNEKLELATISYAMEQVKNLEVTGIVIWLAVVAFQFFVGFKGRAWVLSSLEKRGFDLIANIHAHTKDAVLAELAKKNNCDVNYNRNGVILTRNITENFSSQKSSDKAVNLEGTENSLENESRLPHADIRKEPPAFYSYNNVIIKHNFITYWVGSKPFDSSNEAEKFIDSTT